MKNIYISGPITGQPDGNKPAFDAMHAKIIADGNTSVNPHMICAHLPEGLTHHEYMRVCIGHLVVSDAIVMLPNWENSKGARAEYMVATWCGIEIINE